MSSGILGMQGLSRYLQAYGTIWESFYVIRNYWNAAFVSIFTSICKDLGVIVRHPKLLECSVCLNIYKHVSGYESHVVSSGIIGMQRLSRYVQACGTVWDSFYVIRSYWNAAFFLIFISICKDMRVILCRPELSECSVCLDIYKHM
jgi:hypothetical protein